MRSAQIETLRIQLFKIGARVRETARCIHIRQRLVFSESLPTRLQLFLDLSRPFDNTLAEGPCGAISKNGSEGQKRSSANVFESRRRAAILISYVTNPFSGLRIQK